MPRIHLGTLHGQTGQMDSHTDKQQGVYEIAGNDVLNAVYWALEVTS